MTMQTGKSNLICFSTYDAKYMNLHTSCTDPQVLIH